MVYRSDAETLPMPGAEAGNTKLHAVPKTRAWRFEGFEFDLLRGELHGRNGAAIALRPKAEELLRLFLAQPGRLFSRDELMSAVWPAAVVTDDSLVQCVGELRTALGDCTQRLIRTVPRRGYRLEAAVTPVIDAAPAAALPEPVAPEQAASLPSTSAADTPPSRRPRTWRSLALVLLGVATVVGGGAAFYLRPTVASINIDEVIASRSTVAVMPFVVTAAEPQLRSLADSVADGITAQLATRIGMRGIGRAATMAFDGASPPLARIATALKATHVVTGRVAPVGAGERISIDVQIIAVANGQVIWAKRFEASDASDAAVASDVGQRVAIAMRTRGSLPTGIRATQPGHVPDAADLTLMGWGDLDRRKSLADVQRARGRFEAALREDPRSVIALTGLPTRCGRWPIGPWNWARAMDAGSAPRTWSLPKPP
jgi:DNA-binding winged helix-turn-helix (wHTH) protein/TolB-like protein